MLSRPLGRRSFTTASVGAFGALLSLSAGACLPKLPYAMQPGSLKRGARPHAFQTAVIAWSFTSGIARQWAAAITKLEHDAPPLLSAMREGGHATQLVVRPRRANERGPDEAQYEYYDADLAVLPATTSGAPTDGREAKRRGSAEKRPAPTSKPLAPLVIVGRAGTDKQVYQAAAAAVANATGVPLERVRDGHFALYGLANVLTPLNVSNDALQRHAFKLLVLREKIRAGEKADWFGANREPEESLADIELALRVIADHHTTVAASRAEVIGIIALANGYQAPDAIDALRSQLAESRARNERWVAAHPRPTEEQFGVAMNELILPTPEVLLARLDESGYLSAAITIAKGIATGSVSTTLEGVGKLAPKDGSLRVVIEGLAAASRGDVAAAASSVATLVGKATEGTAIGDRLGKLRDQVATVRGGAAQVAAALGQADGVLGELRQGSMATP